MRSLFLLFVMTCASAMASDLADFCRIKGQEPIKLSGVGVVAGLNGTGDSRFDPKDIAVVQLLRSYGLDIQNSREVLAARNLAMVSVTCEISPFGGRDGDRLDCHVASIGTARSLRGGRLLNTVLKSPLVNDQTAYAIAEGAITLEDQLSQVTGRIKLGTMLWRDMPAPFLRCGDRVTLVVNDGHASWSTAAGVAAAVNEKFALQANGLNIARTVDARNIEVILPPFALQDPGTFLGDLMRTSMPADLIHSDARIIINERTGTIVVTGEVQLKPVLISHRNLVLFPNAGGLVGGPPSNPFVSLSAPTVDPLNPNRPPNPNPLVAPTVSMQNLLDALNRAAVNAEDRIAIVKELVKSGKLHAQVIFE